MLFEKTRGIIISCDIASRDELKALVLGTAGIEGVVGYKLGFMLALRYGLPDAVAVVKDNCDLPVVYDYQKAGTDIPEMGEPFAELMKWCSVDSAIIFPQAGPKTQETFTLALQKHGVTPMVGGEMTHAQYLEKDGGYLRNEAPHDIYERAYQHGVRYFVVPGTKPDAIARYVRQFPDSAFCFPGIGRQGGDLEAAFAACGECSSYAVIGSAIVKSGNAREAAKQFSSVAMRFV